MQGDLTRSTFDEKKRYTSVRMQQGRVQLDADWNEQADILLDNDRELAADVIGRCGVPEPNPGFGVNATATGFTITPGHLYVDGILCENDPGTKTPNLDLASQPDYPGFQDSIKDDGLYLLYADVWERHITSLDDANIREVALGGPDTATRTKLVWQVKALKIDIDLPCKPDGLLSLIQKRDEAIKSLHTETDCAKREAIRRDLDEVIAKIAACAGSCAGDAAAWGTVTAKPTGRMKAFSAPPSLADKPCVVPPGGGYRRLENQLYRVEIHRAGATGDAKPPTFKWSRENASVVFPIGSVAGSVVTVARLGRDTVLDVKADDWVEILDDGNVLLGTPGALRQIAKVNHGTLEVTLKSAAPTVDIAKHAMMRRWDQTSDLTGEGIVITPGVDVELEDGVMIHFDAGTYHGGDYWLIPARAALDDAKGDVIWPRESGTPALLPPAGIAHHYCRLARVIVKSGTRAVIEDCRDFFSPLTDRTAFYYVGGDGQEAMPKETLPQPLQVGVLSDKWPVRGAQVLFELLDGGGGLESVMGGAKQSGCGLTVETNAEGIAACRWTPDPGTSKPSQRVRASLVGGDGRYLPVYFSANLSIASKVAYTPGGCAQLKGATTVQEALDKLCGDSGCHDFLDDLRSDGVVRDAKGVLGLRVTAVPKKLEVHVAPGIAYVGGCRFELKPAAPIAVDRSTTHQTLIVNGKGTLELILAGDLPAKCAPLAIISTFNGSVNRVVDVRRDLTHLDERVSQVDSRAAEAHTDRRAFVPLLAQRIPGLQFQDGRMRRFAFDVGPIDKLTTDGENIWAVGAHATLIGLPRFAASADEKMLTAYPTTQVGEHLSDIVFDGRYLWVAALDAGLVFCVDPASPREILVSIKVGRKPRGMVFDGDFVWVCSISDKGNAVISVIDVETFQVIREIAFDKVVEQKGDARVPFDAITFDGTTIWAIQSVQRQQPNDSIKSVGKVYGIEKPWGEPELMPYQVVGFTGGSLTFDGASVWIGWNTGIARFDVGQPRTLVTLKVSAGEQLAFNGQHVFAATTVPILPATSSNMAKIDVDVDQKLGEIIVPSDCKDLMFDGSFLWFASFEGSVLRRPVS